MFYYQERKHPVLVSRLKREPRDVPPPPPGSFPLSIHDQAEHIGGLNLNLQEDRDIAISVRNSNIQKERIRKIIRSIFLSKYIFFLTRFGVRTFKYHIMQKAGDLSTGSLAERRGYVAGKHWKLQLG